MFRDGECRPIPGRGQFLAPPDMRGNRPQEFRQLDGALDELRCALDIDVEKLAACAEPARFQQECTRVSIFFAYRVSLKNASLKLAGVGADLLSERNRACGRTFDNPISSSPGFNPGFEAI